jgi:hypothetical protein
MKKVKNKYQINQIKHFKNPSDIKKYNKNLDLT